MKTLTEMAQEADACHDNVQITPFLERFAEIVRADERAKMADRQEPVAWLDPWTQNNVTTDYYAYGKHGIPLYTSSPAQRKPLTLREIGAVCGNFSDETIKVVRQTEAAHGIKENT